MRYGWVPNCGLTVITSCFVVYSWDICVVVFKGLSVHNTWSYYNGPLQGNNSNWKSRPPSSDYLPLVRGQPTHVACSDDIGSGKYIQEIAFSPCGRLISTPCGFGLRILAFDSVLSDYRTDMSYRVVDPILDFLKEFPDLPYSTFPEPNQFHTASFCFGHHDIVLSTCFSPTRMQVVSGSKDGNILFHEVVL